MKTILKFVLLLASILVIASCEKKKVEPAKTGEVVPDFSLTDLDGNIRKLSDYKGKVVVLFLFGNTCPSCIAVGPQIQSEIADKYAANSNFVILGLDQWNGTKSAVESFKSKTGIKFPLLLNASSVQDAYATQYDRLLVVDKDGFLRFKGAQVASNDIENVIATVDKHL